ncbi:bifunctional acetate--CoA ligase family protein/GNAT family N-acetyltransferase [Magnetospirillum fulvum]|uniref:Acetyltransferase n=1 Tax=Magnetospirillum fulvum TaxID=1082 RepID=A0A1H6HCA3_MAGFU|nr:bifunctional acetate--CoA ligase family protein/GNAT family N-acetyltransferase [Magnetospirillum fulvum]SEH32742.1 acetyltransferase [Magnetospirillum fulvum]
MSLRNLSHLFAPASVAVIGASDRPLSAGAVVMHNLLTGGFKGPIMPVNSHQRAVAGVLAYPDVESLPLVPDLAVLCTPGAGVPDLIEHLGRIGTRAAIVIATDVDRPAMLAAARHFGVRVLGTGSLGILVPRIGLMASFSHLQALPGKVALVSQSGELCGAVLDWARPHGIGFSHFISLGDGDDIDFADVLDYLANDDQTRAILLYIEQIRRRGDLVAAARAAARNKPLLLVRVPGHLDIRRPGAFLSEALASPEECFDAAVRRSGALRVGDVDELFGAVETLARARTVPGHRLAVVSNGGGMARMAQAEMDEPGGPRLAELSEATRAKLAALLPKGTAIGNPLDLGLDADGKRYGEAVRTLIESEEVNAVLAVHAPNAMTEPVAPAQAVIEAQKRQHGAVLTAWVGEEAVAPARRLFAEAGLPTYATPGQAVRAFRHLVHYRRNQTMLMETPPSQWEGFAEARIAARPIVERGLSAPEGMLIDSEARALLAAYGIPIQAAERAATPEDAAAAAERLGFPVSLTLDRPDLARKTEAGAIALGLDTAEAVRTAALAIRRRVAADNPEAESAGFTVQRSLYRPEARLLIAGIACDPLFGPVIVFGEGGRAVEVPRDHTVGLPPLNLPLARSMIGRTRIARLLKASDTRPAADRDAVAEVLVRLSRMLADNPEIVACDINPLFADNEGVVALDARVRVRPWEDSDLRRFAILPYPAELEENAVMKDGTPILLRPIRPEDEPAHAELIAKMTPQDLRMRFFGLVREVQHFQLARMTQIDYEREMAFIATRTDADGHQETLGVVRTVADPDNQRAELGILVRSDLKGTGLGHTLLDKIIRHQRTRGTGQIFAQIMSENMAMLKLARRAGFRPHPSGEHEVIELVLDLQTGPPEAS